MMLLPWWPYARSRDPASCCAMWVTVVLRFFDGSCMERLRSSACFRWCWLIIWLLKCVYRCERLLWSHFRCVVASLHLAWYINRKFLFLNWRFSWKKIQGFSFWIVWKIAAINIRDYTFFCMILFVFCRCFFCSYDRFFCGASPKIGNHNGDLYFGRWHSHINNLIVLLPYHCRTPFVRPIGSKTNFSLLSSENAFDLIWKFLQKFIYFFSLLYSTFL